MKAPSCIPSRARPSLGLAAVILTLFAGPRTASAARISEPSTVLYGRVVERVGQREFLRTTGNLTWNLRTTGPAGRAFQLTAPLRPLGGGVYSYQLAIPHEVLAYDLTVRSNALGLAGSAAPVEHLSVTVDGQPLTINPAAVAGFSLSQPQRASALRIDLAFSTNTQDSDGDGLPDWWEDQNGFNKYDPTDAAKALSLTPALSAPDSALAAQAQTFASWRSAWFPANADDLDAFGLQDPDRDGISNLFEYAFDLNPTQADANGLQALPHIINLSGRTGLAFQKRATATDLTYRIESSADLFTWQDASNDIETVSTPGASAAISSFAVRPGHAPSHLFLRVRIYRQ